MDDKSPQSTWITRERVTLSMERDDAQALRDIARDTNRTISGMVTELVRAWLCEKATGNG